MSPSKSIVSLVILSALALSSPTLAGVIKTNSLANLGVTAATCANLDANRLGAGVLYDACVAAGLAVKTTAASATSVGSAAGAATGGSIGSPASIPATATNATTSGTSSLGSGLAATTSSLGAALGTTTAALGASLGTTTAALGSATAATVGSLGAALGTTTASLGPVVGATTGLLGSTTGAPSSGSLGSSCGGSCTWNSTSGTGAPTTGLPSSGTPTTGTTINTSLDLYINAYVGVMNTCNSVSGQLATILAGVDRLATATVAKLSVDVIVPALANIASKLDVLVATTKDVKHCTDSAVEAAAYQSYATFAAALQSSLAILASRPTLYVDVDVKAAVHATLVKLQATLNAFDVQFFTYVSADLDGANLKAALLLSLDSALKSTSC